VFLHLHLSSRLFVLRCFVSSSVSTTARLVTP
jgi:hypothetical protein